MREGYHDTDGCHGDDRRMEDAMVRREDYDEVVEDLGEATVANEVLQFEVEAWKYTTARSLVLLNEIVKEYLTYPRELAIRLAQAEALLRELGVHWDLPVNERNKELDALLSHVSQH